MVFDKEITQAIKTLQQDSNRDIRQLALSITLFEAKYDKADPSMSLDTLATTAVETLLLDEPDSMYLDSYSSNLDMELEIMITDAITSAVQ